MRPQCDDCTPPKHMIAARIICGPFAWRGFFCPVCYDVMFLRKLDRRGFRLTKWLFEGEVLVHGAH